MLAKIIDWSGRNRFLVLLATLFVVVGGVFAVIRTPLDALPDLSDVQVIVYTEYPGQAPQVVEDQVTYPLTTAMLSVPKSKVVRGFSFFGASFVYIIFEDGTDLASKLVLSAWHTGKQADFCLWDIATPAQLAYSYGVNPCKDVVKNGKLVHQ